MKSTRGSPHPHQGLVGPDTRRELGGHSAGSGKSQTHLKPVTTVSQVSQRTSDKTVYNVTLILSEHVYLLRSLLKQRQCARDHRGGPTLQGQVQWGTPSTRWPLGLHGPGALPGAKRPPPAAPEQLLRARPVAWRVGTLITAGCKRRGHGDPGAARDGQPLSLVGSRLDWRELAGTHVPGGPTPAQGGPRSRSSSTSLVCRFTLKGGSLLRFTLSPVVPGTRARTRCVSR